MASPRFILRLAARAIAPSLGGTLGLCALLLTGASGCSSTIDDVSGTGASSSEEHAAEADSDDHSAEATGGGASHASGGRAGDSDEGDGGEAQSDAGVDASEASGGGLPDVCCLAAAVCEPSDIQVDSEEECRRDPSCYSNSICCSQVWCVSPEPVTCQAFPACADDETEVKECPPGASCVERTLCGSTILCAPAETPCDASAEPSRDYVGDSPEMCQLIKYACPEDTSWFSNACGCGCEQSPDCPESVNCMPGWDPEDDVSALCDQPDVCPYTVRAQ